jgi:hypothetical protein
MDFIIGLPKSEGKDAIFVVMNTLKKYALFVEFKVHIQHVEQQKCS